jgi:hypothetical protein
MSQLPRCHLNRYMMTGRRLPDVRVASLELQPQTRCRAADQVFIRIAAAPTELVVEVRDSQSPPVHRGQGAEHMEHYH